MRDLLAIADKGAAPQRQRENLAVAAASSDTPTPAEFVEAFFGLKAQAEKLQRIEDRLERMAVAAETGGSPSGVAVLSAQALRGIETGPKLAGLPGFVPARGADQVTAGTKFSVVIQLGDGIVERITTVDEPAHSRTIDADDAEPGEG
jgi:hypothetical protein